MRFCYIALLAATAILASFGDTSAATVLNQSTRASVDAIQPIEAAQTNSNRSLRRRKNDEDEEAVEEERNGFESLAAKLNSNLLPKIRQVVQLDLGRAALTLQQMSISFDERQAIQALLRLSKEDRKAVLMLIK